MLVLARKSKETVVIGAAGDMQELVRVTVLEIRGGVVKLGFKADDDVAVYREEVWDRLRAESQAATSALVTEGRIIECRTWTKNQSLHDTVTGEGLKEPRRHKRSIVGAVEAQFVPIGNSKTQRGDECQLYRKSR